MPESNFILLSPHFHRHEFEPDVPMPDDCVEICCQLCLQVLEPIRIQFGPLIINSGYRPPEVNDSVHGAKQSQHEYTPERCACDFKLQILDPQIPTVAKRSMRDVFDWIRLASKLPVDQVILEHGEHEDIVHVSYVIGHPPRQEALEGLTANRSGYMTWRFNK